MENGILPRWGSSRSRSGQERLSKLFSRPLTFFFFSFTLIRCPPSRFVTPGLFSCLFINETTEKSPPRKQYSQASTMESPTKSTTSVSYVEKQTSQTKHPRFQKELRKRRASLLKFSLIQLFGFDVCREPYSKKPLRSSKEKSLRVQKRFDPYMSCTSSDKASPEYFFSTLFFQRRNSISFNYLSVIDTISGVLPTRIGGPQVPIPFVV